MKVSEPPICVEQVLESDLTSVWNAITDLNQMKQWYFEAIPEFEPKVGFQTSFVVQNEGRTFTHLWKVTEVQFKKRLVYNWKYAKYHGDSYVSFDLTENTGTTTIKVTATVVEDFPDELPEFKRESCQAGWHYFINERLKEYLS